MLPCIDLHIPDTWVASAVHTPDNTHTNARAAQLGPAHTRTYAAVGCEHGRSAHMWRYVYIFA
jgi:hypothetical protein